MARVTIADGGTTSGAATFGAGRPIGFFMPAAFTGTALTFSGSVDGTTYQTVYDSAGAAVSVTVAAARAVGLTAAQIEQLRPWPYLKVISGAAETPARIIEIVED